MRVLHTADWHLGKQIRNTSLIEDQAHVLDQLHVVLKESAADCLVVAGDVFDRSLPSTEAVMLFDDVLHRLAVDFRKPVIIISGNHDSAERLSFGSRLFETNNILIENNRGVGSSTTITDKYGPITILSVPYLDPPVARERLSRSDIHSHEDALKSAVEHLKSQKETAARSILVSHAYAQGGLSCDSERPLSIGGSEVVSAEIFSSFSYVALGHLHRPQAVAASHVRYAGSLLKYSASEIDHNKSFSLVDINERGDTSIEEIAIIPRRDFRELRGKLAELLAPSFPAGNRDDYFLFILEDEGSVIDAMPRLREVYPNALDIRRTFLHTPPLEPATSEEHLKQDPISLFKSFAAAVSGIPLTDTHIDTLRKVVTEASKEEGKMP